MSTYSENLEVTVDNVLTSLATEQQKRASEQISAEYSLYYAQGARFTAQDRLNEVVKEYDFAQSVDKQGIKNDNLAINLLASSEQAEKNVATTVTNAATAASNVQIASNAIAQLASDIGSAFNIVSAANYGTDIYQLTQRTNELIRKTANNAEYISQLAMEATTATSEIISSKMLDEVKGTKTEVEKLLSVTESEFSRLVTERTTDTQKLAAASKSEKVAEGILLDGNREYSASTIAYKLSNAELNFGLTTEVISAEEFSVSHSAMKQSFSTLEVSNSKDGFIPAATPDYFITIVKADKKKLFNLQLAELNFAEFKDERYIPVSGKTTKVNVSKYRDSDGDKINAGESYVVFLYLELSLSYKKFINNFSDILSSASTAFALSDQLPIINDYTYNSEDNSLSFSVGDDAVPGTDYRCIFLPDVSDKKQDMLTGVEQSAKIPGFYFNLSIAEQVSASNYTLAIQSADNSSDYSLSIADDTTDNFGNELIAGEKYVPVILSVLPDSVSSSNQYTNSMTDLSKAQSIILKSDDLLSNSVKSKQVNPANDETGKTVDVNGNKEQ